MTTAPFKVKAIFEYKSPHDDDLSFPNGQIITVTEEVDADWYVGEYVDGAGSKQEGMFPHNFVEKYEPEAPPRPTRTRAKRDTAPPLSAEPVANDAVPEPAPQPVAPEPAISEPVEAPHAEQPVANPLPQKSLETTPEPNAEPVKSASASKGPPPAVSEKPSSFKDRIAAFNRPQAKPIAPVKPGSISGGGASFIKKPFVAPPPARNAFVPPPREPAAPKAYRREEDPEIKERQAEDQESAEKAGLTSTEGTETTEEETKTTSLKDRIAALQKQQQEQAARRADASQKEKPKKPQKKRTESSEHIATAASASTEEGTASHGVESPEMAARDSIDEPRDIPITPAGRRPSRDTRMPAAETISDGNEADQSGAGDTTEDGDASSTEVEGHDERNRSAQAFPPPRTSTSLSRGAPSLSTGTAADEESKDGHSDEDEVKDKAKDEEEEVDSEDEETRRKRELRERMAKMSGGMGMPGMFAMPPGASAPRHKQPSGASEQKSATEAEISSSPPITQRVPMIPVIGMTGTAKSSVTAEPEVIKEPEVEAPSIAERDAVEVPNVEDLEQKPSIAPHAAERTAPPIPQDRPLPPPPPSAHRGNAPPVPGGRPVPQPPEGLTAPPPPPRGPRAAEGVDQETPILAQAASRASQELPIIRGPPPPIPGMPQRPDGPRSPPASQDKRTSFLESTTSPISPPDNRQSRAVPPPPPAEARLPPPPPPPTAAPPSRKSTGHDILAAQVAPDDVGHGETDYEGDYDTDIASGADHNKALNKVHDREPSADDITLSEETSARSPPSGPPPVPGMFQSGPPPPPHRAPISRQSVDVPRDPPPAPPPRVVTSAGDEDYDPYSYHAPRHGVSSPPLSDEAVAGPLIQASDPALYGESSQSISSAAPVMVSQSPTDRAPPPPTGASRTSRELPRPLVDAPRKSMTAGRISADQPRPSTDQGQMAHDVDLAQSSQWWTQPKTPPPVFQKRNDVLCEFDDTTTTKRGGRTSISRDVYVLFSDYSQTVVTAQFDSKNPSDVILEQRHEAPPPRLRQDQLEQAYSTLGTAISAAASKHQNHTIGDGTAQALILDVLGAQSNALLPVGSRAYGALVYSNMANATVTQHDEIRAGDIISFRNAKFSGKHGAMHAKYSEDVGKPEHVGVVVEWDGTKKKVRALEQGRESKKVKVESFRVGDLRSGEVKVWRVMDKSWVGWETGS